MHTVLTVFKIIASFVILIVLTTIALVGTIITLGIMQDAVFEKIIAPAARLVLRVNGVKLVVDNPHPVDRPVVYITNHSSTLDMFVIASLALPHTRYVAKYELLYNPLFFILGKATGQIFVKRQEREKAVSTIQKAYVRARKNNFSLFVAPEGTRKHEGLVGPFKKGAFRIALDMQYPIVPLHIKGARQLCPGGSLSVTPGTVTVTYKPMIDTSGWKLETLDQHIQSVREQYLAWETEDIEQ